MDNTIISIITNDNSVDEYKRDILKFLKEYKEENYLYTLSSFKNGQKDMLDEIIKFIENN